jgi:hypothetical protein
VSLNDAQVAVLRWIADGSPAGVMEGYAHRISASALRSRALVRIFGRGETWRAELTDRGREQLGRLDGELTVMAASGEVGRAARIPQPLPATQTDARAESLAQPLSKSERLVADVIAAGGRLSLPDETARGGVNWRQRAYAAQRHGKVPEGMRLSVSRSKAGFEIALLEGGAGNLVRTRWRCRHA